MLQAIRERSTGLIAGFIIAVICLLFAFSGIGSYFTGNSNPTVAKVGDTEIKYSEFQNRYQNNLSAAQRGGGEVNEAIIKQQTIDSLVSGAIVNDFTATSGYTASEEQVADYLTNSQFFHEDGKFSRDRFNQMMAMMRTTPTQYAQRVKVDLANRQLQNGISDSVVLSPAEIKQGYALENEEREVSLVKIDPVQLESKQDVSDEEVLEYYSANAAGFFTEERIKLDYLELNAADIAKTLDISDEDISSRYEADKALYTTAETRRASHILLKTDKRSVEEAKQQLADIKTKVESGEDFAVLAKEHSDDIGSAQQGGDLNWFGTGRMVPEFEAATFALEEGQMSDLVETQFGVHLIKLTGIRPESVKPLDDVKDEVVAALQKEQAADKMAELSGKLADLTYENPETLQAAADELNLEIKTTGWITASTGTGIGNNVAVRKAALDGLVKTDGENSDRIELGDDRVVVIRKNQYEAARQQTQEEVAGNITATIKKQKASEQAVELAKKLEADLKEGKSLADAAKAYDLEVEEAKFKRADKSFKPEVVAVTFAAAAPTENSVVAAATVTSDNVNVILELKNVVAAEEEPAEAQLNGVKARLARQRGNAEVAALLKAIRNNADISVDASRL